MEVLGSQGPERLKVPLRSSGRSGPGCVWAGTELDLCSFKGVGYFHGIIIPLKDPMRPCRAPRGGREISSRLWQLRCAEDIKPGAGQGVCSVTSDYQLFSDSTQPVPYRRHLRWNQEPQMWGSRKLTLNCSDFEQRSFSWASVSSSDKRITSIFIGSTY